MVSRLVKAGGYGFRRPNPEIILAGVRTVKAFLSAPDVFLKKRILGVGYQGISIPDTIQLGDQRRLSTSGGTDGIRYNTFEGNRNACNVWWNRSKRKANLNWVENYDNSNDWFAFLRYCLLSPAPAGVSFWNSTKTRFTSKPWLPELISWAGSISPGTEFYAPRRRGEW